ncbi:hypothetical protein [Mucilaginibacter boryungensis]|uniref:DUF3298 domain-containing protein n=1 Tax=Mucilaginibacter boryungensis TaxID=768480 RepID=A0ABR9XLL8_9SPHI|nr:hypothetical protein [Mucilaginibacter boryungensis]MBE9668288.1 hypothetical protein [Mucilaginibacter boryungensis]
MKPWAFLSVLLLCSIGALAQDKALRKSHIIHPKKIYMKYRDNLNPDSLIIPIVSDKYPQLKKTLSEEHLVNDEPIINNVKRFETDGTGITWLDYEIPFESKDILSIHLYYESMGAHPEEYQEWDTYNIHTGKPYPISNEINQTGLNWVFRTYKQQYKKAIHEDQAWREKKDEEYKRDIDEEKLFYNELYHSIDTLSKKEMFTHYAFTKKGVTFVTERILPHMRQSYEPSRDWFVPCAKLRQFKKPGALVIK